ncbi:MAG: hypothetical protein JKY32_07980 [Rhizobiales bacterium]|nr:hypothetical protein [Hyphomicrobiales bacterium]
MAIIAPKGFEAVPVERLGFDGNNIIDLAEINQFYISAMGVKNVVHAEPKWQLLNCFVDDILFMENGVWRVQTNADKLAAIADQRLNEIKQAVRQRIYAVASAETQMNMSGVAAFISSKTAANRDQSEKDHMSAYEASLNWVGSMRANVATLASDASLDLADDANWPVTPPEVIALAAQF